jgi:3-oxoadipate enol-lactonase
MQHVSANGTTIAVAVTGAGSPLVLIHGAEADHTMFRHFAPLLARHASVLAYDQRDSGETINPVEPYTMADMADDVAALVAALGHARAHVFGTSLGGMIGQVLAIRHPERVDRLVLASTMRIGKTLGHVNPAVDERLRALREDRQKNAPEIATYFFPAPFLADHPEAVDIFRGQSRSAEQQRRRARMMASGEALELSRIRAPTLVLAGAEDRLIPSAHSLAIADEIPGATKLLLDGVAHVGTMHAPERIADAVLAFLR